jgi:indolepyruvate ferredoxin oxidoreductase, beta subunit
MQQIAISGVGGQGILFITGVLAETALELGYGVFISETHGMAQRGGNVISHLKVGAPAAPEGTVQTRSPQMNVDLRAANSEFCFHSPLIRPGHADILLALHPDGLVSHSFYLKPGGATFANLPESFTTPEKLSQNRLEQSSFVRAEVSKHEQARSPIHPSIPLGERGSFEIVSETSLDASLIATELGAPVCANLVLLGFAIGFGQLFCTAQDVERVLRRLGGSRAEINLKAFRAGLGQAGHRNAGAKR